jgi:hypothetical protein
VGIPVQGPLTPNLTLIDVIPTGPDYTQTITCTAAGVDTPPATVYINVTSANVGYSGNAGNVGTGSRVGSGTNVGNAGNTGRSPGNVGNVGPDGRTDLSLSFTIRPTDALIGGFSATVESGSEAFLQAARSSGMDITSATLQCLNNSDDAISLFYGSKIYCGPSTNNIPYSVGLQTFPEEGARIRLINNIGTDATRTIQLTTNTPTGPKIIE